MTKYLYGASVQGIQEFIFQTNKLREIAGASELVEQICTTEFTKKLGYNDDYLEQDPNAIISAAGNIRYLFQNKEECEKVVQSFPKEVMETAPGISLIQAVVEIEDEKLGKKHNDLLEKKLHAQRNKKIRSYELGLLALNRSRRTGIPANTIRTLKGEPTIIDKGTASKLDTKSKRVLESFYSTYNDKHVPWDMQEITKSKNDSYSWLAVVHADGNNMGLLLQKFSEAVENMPAKEYAEKLRAFSRAIDKSTKEAAQKAYMESLLNVGEEKIAKLPFRPIVIGGDDLTIICRADLALEFTGKFLRYFNEQTIANLKDLNIDMLNDGITACAGIAFIKESYPFHYGYSLADDLCKHAKKLAKENFDNESTTPSCLMFHKVQDSFVAEYSDMQKRELTVKTNETRLDYGPYFLERKPGFDTVSGLLDKVSQLKSEEGNAVKSNLRQWLTDLHNNDELAKQKLDRIHAVAGPGTKKILNKLGLPDSAIENGKSPVYDWLTINSLL